MTPELGEIRRGREIGRHPDHRYIWYACVDCGKERWVFMYKGQPKNLRCFKCAPKERGLKHQGEKHPYWKGGRTKSSHSYIQIMLFPDDFFYSMADQRGYVLEHRLVVAKALGRCLHRWEIVHHKHTKYPAGSIEDKQDNRYPDNLQLVTDDRHKQITILENRIKLLNARITLLEAENIGLKQEVKI